MSEDVVIYTLLIVGLLALLGFLGDRIFQRTGFPDVLLLLLVGTLIGPFLGLIDLDKLALITPYFSTFVLIFILFDGGLELDFNVILKQILPVTILVTLSIVTVMVAVASITMNYYDWHWLPSLILASFLSNISGAIVLPVVNRLAIKDEDKSILKLEAAASDVLVIIIFVTLMSLLQAFGTEGGTTVFSPRETLSTLAGSFSKSVVIGSVAGTAWMVVLNRIYRLQHNYMATLGTLLMLYSVSEFLNASGMMAVLFFGIVLANSAKFGHFFNIKEIRYTPHEMKHLHATFSFLLRTFFLVYIGFFLSGDMLEVKFLTMGLFIVTMLVVVRVFTGIVFSWIFKKDGIASLAVISMLPRGLAVAALASAPGIEVDKMISEKQDIVRKVKNSSQQIQDKLDIIHGQLAEFGEQKGDEEIKDQVIKGIEKLTRKQIDLSADLRVMNTQVAGHENSVKNLEDIKEATDTFILFAPLSILVTNILMTIGCLMVKRKSTSATENNDSPPSSNSSPADSNSSTEVKAADTTPFVSSKEPPVDPNSSPPA